MANMEHGADEQREVRQGATQSTTDCTADWSRHLAVIRQRRQGGKVVFHWGRDPKWPKSWKRFAMASFTCLPGCVSVWVASNIHTIVATICGARVFDMCVCVCLPVCVCSHVCDSCIMRVFVAVAKGKRKWRKNVSRFNGRSCGFNAISHNKWPSWRNISDTITSIIIIIIIILVIIIMMLLSRCSATRHVQHAYAMFSVADPPWLYTYNIALSLSPSLSLFLFHHVAQWTDKCNYVAVLCVLNVCACVCV